MRRKNGLTQIFYGLTLIIYKLIRVNQSFKSHLCFISSLHLFLFYFQTDF